MSEWPIPKSRVCRVCDTFDRNIRSLRFSGALITVCLYVCCEHSVMFQVNSECFVSMQVYCSMGDDGGSPGTYISL